MHTPNIRQHQVIVQVLDINDDDDDEKVQLIQLAQLILQQPETCACSMNECYCKV